MGDFWWYFGDDLGHYYFFILTDGWRASYILKWSLYGKSHVQGPMLVDDGHWVCRCCRDAMMMRTSGCKYRSTMPGCIDEGLFIHVFRTHPTHPPHNSFPNVCFFSSFRSLLLLNEPFATLCLVQLSSSFSVRLASLQQRGRLGSHSLDLRSRRDSCPVYWCVFHPLLR